MLSIDKALYCRDTARLNLNIVQFQGKPFAFQARDIGYMFFIQKTLLANQTGLGKTIEIIGLNCLQKQHNRLRCHIQVVPAQSLLQWYSEYRKFAPHLLVRAALGRPVDRIGTYNSTFDVLLISYNTLWHDWQYVASLGYNSIAFDEASFFKNPSSKTSDIVTTLARSAEWAIPITATPIQNCVVDLWSVYQVLNMPGLLGGQVYFTNRYCKQEIVHTYVDKKKKRTTRITGYQNLDELKARINPFYLRRRVVDPEVDQAMPALQHDVRWVTLHPAQREAYDIVRTDVLRKGYRGKELRSRFHSLKKLVDGMKTYDDHAPDISIKSDTVMELLTGDLADDKSVIFSWYKTNLRSLSERMKTAHIKHDFIWGDEPDKQVRWKTQETFRQDPSLRVILGTTALEMSLNLQAARFLIFYDLLYNPSRNLQVIGRIRRLGSQHGTCVVVSLLAADTLEEKLWETLTRRAAISDFVFDEGTGGEVFDKLTDDELYQLLRADK